MQGAAVLATSELSVRLSVCQTRALWQSERNLCLYSYTEWKTIYHLRQEERLVGETHLGLPEILGQSDLVEATTPIFNRYSHLAEAYPSSSKTPIFDIFARSGSAVTTSKKFN